MLHQPALQLSGVLKEALAQKLELCVSGANTNHHQHNNQTRWGGLGQVPAHLGLSWLTSSQWGSRYLDGPVRLRGDNGYEEFLGGQTQRRVRRTRLNYQAFLRHAFPLLPRTQRPPDEVGTVRQAKSSCPRQGTQEGALGAL